MCHLGTSADLGWVANTRQVGPGAAFGHLRLAVASNDGAAADVRGIRGLPSIVGADELDDAEDQVAPVVDMLTGERVA